MLVSYKAKTNSSFKLISRLLSSLNCLKTTQFNTVSKQATFGTEAWQARGRGMLENVIG